MEIFQHIFALLSSQDLDRAFSGLNSYIDSIIQSMINLSITVMYKNRTNTMRFLHLFARRISRLVMHVWEIPDFDCLLNLRSLILKNGTRAQLDCIRPHNFPLLEYLYFDDGKQNNEFVSNSYKICRGLTCQLLNDGGPFVHKTALNKNDLKTPIGFQFYASSCKTRPLQSNPDHFYTIPK